MEEQLKKIQNGLGEQKESAEEEILGSEEGEFEMDEEMGEDE